MKRAIVAGSFDPITKGHKWMIEKAAELFDEVLVVVANNPNKKSMFTVNERVDAIRKTINCEDGTKIRVSVMDSYVFTVDYALKNKCTHIVRGIRNTTDFEFEHQLNLINRDIAPNVETLYLMPPRELIEVSSSMVKGLIGLNGWQRIASKYVSERVLEMLNEKYSATQCQ